MAAVVEATAAATDTHPLELGPLTNAVDPDALEALIRPARATTEVRFAYAGCSVTVAGDGVVTVTAP